MVTNEKDLYSWFIFHQISGEVCNTSLHANSPLFPGRTANFGLWSSQGFILKKMKH